MSDNLALSDMIRKAPGRNGKSRKFGPEGAWTAPEGAGGDAPETAEASENAGRSARSDEAAALPARPAWRWPAVGRTPSLRAIGPEGAPAARLLDRAEASDSDASGRCGAPSPTPPFPPAPPRPVTSLRSRSGPPIEPTGRHAGQAPGASACRTRSAQAPGRGSPRLPAQRRRRLKRPCPATRVGADGSHAPADADAQPDPKRDPHGGVRDGAEDREPEGAAPETRASGANPPALLPSAGRLSGRLAALAETAKAYARSAQADNTQRAYAADWRHSPPGCAARVLRRRRPTRKRSASTSLHKSNAAARNFRSRPSNGACPGSPGATVSSAQPLEIRDRHIATVLAGIRRRHGRPPLQKAAIFADELLAMLATLDMDLRGLRDRAILAIGFAGGLRRSEIVGLDCGPRQTEDGSGWVEILPEGALLTIRGKTGWRDVEIGRGSRPDTCPVALLETWLRLGRIGHGPLFRAIARKNGGVSGERLTDKHVVRLVKTCALAAGLRGDLAEGERRLAFGGHSLRAGLASSAQIEEAHVQKHLGHASAEMTRRYQRKRDRFKINLTKAAGL